jgi:hypothetical protein
MLATASYPSQLFMYNSFNSRQHAMHPSSPAPYSSSVSPQLDHSTDYNNWPAGACLERSSRQKVFSHVNLQTTVATHVMSLVLAADSSTICRRVSTSPTCLPQIRREPVAGARVTMPPLSEVQTSGHRLPFLLIPLHFRLPALLVNCIKALSVSLPTRQTQTGINGPRTRTRT